MLRHIMMQRPHTQGLELLQLLVHAAKDYAIAEKHHKAKRKKHKYARDNTRQALNTKTATLRIYLAHRFQERAMMLERLFNQLDNCLQQGESQHLNLLIHAILSMNRDFSVNPKVPRFESNEWVSFDDEETMIESE